MIPTPWRVASGMLLSITLGTLSGCQPASEQADKAKISDIQSDDILVGCYTVSHDEPAQIKISKLNPTGATGGQYVMQMHQFSDPNKDWDTPEPLQVLDNNAGEIERYFDIKADEHRYLQRVIARPDRMFVLAKLTDSFAQLNPQFDSPYLGFIYKGSNTIYKVDCSANPKLANT